MNRRMESAVRGRMNALLATIGGFLLTVGCGVAYDRALPASNTLGTVGTRRVARVITHFHTPYSYDACDNKGLDGSTPNATCLSDIREALCSNRIDAIFLTDHPAHAAQFEMRDLLLASSGDTVFTSGDGTPYAHRASFCGSLTAPMIFAGYESKLMPLGMTRHLSTDAATRLELYGGEDRNLRERLALEAEAIVAIPHTESRSVSTLKALQPDLIEIYNIHANLDPKIRMRDLGAPPFSNLASLLSFLVDPYGGMVPDFSFIGFFEISSIYAERWNALLASGLRVGGIAGSDSHENIFPQKVSDSERLDSHRRMLHFISNHVLVESLDPLEIKAALRKGRSWIAVEGLGTPKNFQLEAVQGGTRKTIGDALSLASGAIRLEVSPPVLHESSAGEHLKKAPTIRTELHHIDTNGTETTVAAGSGATLLTLESASRGAYRVHSFITPSHLQVYLGPFAAEANREFPWVVSNPLYVEP